MYMPGRFLTASSPSSLSIWAASYFCVLAMPAGRTDETDFTGKSSSVLGIEDGRATTDKYGSGKCACHNKYLVKISSSRALGLELAEPKTPAHCGRSLPVAGLVLNCLTIPFSGRKMPEKLCVFRLFLKAGGSSRFCSFWRSHARFSRCCCLLFSSR